MKTCEHCTRYENLIRKLTESRDQKDREIELLRDAVRELNVRLHERTQGFLSRSGPFKRP